MAPSTIQQLLLEETPLGIGRMAFFFVISPLFQTAAVLSLRTFGVAALGGIALAACGTLIVALGVVTHQVRAIAA